MVGMRLLPGASLALALAASRPAHADQLGYDFSAGVVLAGHGPLAAGFTPIVAGSFGLVGYRGPWEVDVGVITLDGIADVPAGRSSIGGSAGLRRYVQLAGGTSNGVRWRVAAFGAAGWTVLAIDPPSIDPTARDALAPGAVIAPSVGATTVTGPRLGAGLELSLAKGPVCSHVALSATDQELAGGGVSGGYGTVELSMALGFGH